MTLLTTRFKTYTVGDEFEASEGNQLQDGIIANCHRVTTRTIIIAVDGINTIVSGTPFEQLANGKIESGDSGDEVRIPINGLWLESAAQIVQVTARVSQAFDGDLWGLEIKQDNGDGTETVFGPFTTNTAGTWKDVVSPSLAIDIETGKRWRVHMTHGAEGTGTDPLLWTQIQVVLGG